MTDTESIRTLATVTLDARALDELGPQTIERLAEPLLTTPQAARAAGVHPETVRRAIKAGALRTAGYVGNRPRMRREDVDAWVAGGESGCQPGSPNSVPRTRPPRLRRAGPPRKLGEALSSLMPDGRAA